MTEAYENIRKIAIGQGDNYATGYWLSLFQRSLQIDCNRFK